MTKVDYAIINGKLWTANQVTPEFYNALEKKSLRCAQCEGNVIWRRQHVRLREDRTEEVRSHFAHTSALETIADYDKKHSKESANHLRLKTLLVRDFKTITFAAKCCDLGEEKEYTFHDAAEAIAELTIPFNRKIRPDVTLKDAHGQTLAYIEVHITHRRTNWEELVKTAKFVFQIENDTWKSNISIRPGLKPCSTCEQTHQAELERRKESCKGKDRSKAEAIRHFFELGERNKRKLDSERQQVAAATEKEPLALQFKSERVSADSVFPVRSNAKPKIDQRPKTNGVNSGCPFCANKLGPLCQTCGSSRLVGPKKPRLRELK